VSSSGELAVHTAPYACYTHTQKPRLPLCTPSPCRPTPDGEHLGSKQLRFCRWEPQGRGWRRARVPWPAPREVEGSTGPLRRAGTPFPTHRAEGHPDTQNLGHQLQSPPCFLRFKNKQEEFFFPQKLPVPSPPSLSATVTFLCRNREWTRYGAMPCPRRGGARRQRPRLQAPPRRCCYSWWGAGGCSPRTHELARASPRARFPRAPGACALHGTPRNIYGDENVLGN